MPIMGLDRTNGSKSYGELPFAFVANRGQIGDSRIAYQAHGRGCRFAFGAGTAWMSFWTRTHSDTGAGERAADGVTLAWTFRGALSEVRPEGREPEPGTFNRFRGSDPAGHVSGVPLYRHIAYREVWPGIDVVFNGRGGRLKYDVHLRPGARVGDVSLRCEGADGLRLDEEGNLLIATAHGVLTDLKPVAYQERDGRSRPIGCRFVLHPEPDGSHAVGFELEGDYDPSLPLVIDPVLVYSSYPGGSDEDASSAIALDASGCAYVTDLTFSADFPVTPGAFSTMLVGITEAPDFPATPKAFQPEFGGARDIFVAKIGFSGAFTTGVLQNLTAAGPVASSAILLIGNGSAVDAAMIRIAAFRIDGGSRIPFVSKLMTVPPGSALARSYNVQSFPAFEIQYELAGPGFGSTVVSVFPADGLGNPLPALRVLQAEATPIFKLYPLV